MESNREYPDEWLERVPAIVFGVFVPGEIRIILHPGVGLANGGAPRDLKIHEIPYDLRLPNTLLWVQLDKNMNVIRVWRRDEE